MKENKKLKSLKVIKDSTTPKHYFANNYLVHSLKVIKDSTTPKHQVV